MHLGKHARIYFIFGLYIYMDVHLCACMYVHVKGYKNVMFIHVNKNIFQHHHSINDKKKKKEYICVCVCVRVRMRERS